MFLFKAAVTEFDRLRCQSVVDSLIRELESKVNNEVKQLDGKNPLETFARWEKEIVEKYDRAMSPTSDATWYNVSIGGGSEASVPEKEKSVDIAPHDEIQGEQDGNKTEKRIVEDSDQDEFTQVRIRRRILLRNIAKQRIVFLQNCGIDVSEDGHVVEEMPPPTCIPDENLNDFRERLIFENPGSSITDECLERTFGHSRRFIKSGSLYMVYKDHRKPIRSRSKSGCNDLDNSAEGNGNTRSTSGNKDVTEERLFYLLSGALVITIPRSDGKLLFSQFIDLKGCRIKCDDFYGSLDASHEVNKSENFDVGNKNEKKTFSRFKIIPCQGSKLEVESKCIEERDSWLEVITAAICDYVEPKYRYIGWRHRVRLGTIHAAVVNEDYKSIQKYKQYCELGRMDYSIFDRLDDDGFAPIHYACMMKSTETVRVLIEVGADVTIKDLQGSSPLHWSCLQLDHVNLGALCGGIFDTDHIDDRGNTPLYIACVAGRDENNKVDVSALLKCVEILTSLGADVNYRDSDGISILQYAIYNWQVEVVDVLMNAGAKIDVRSVNDSVNYPSPLHLILRGEPLECKLYFNRSSLPKSGDNNGEVNDTAEEAHANTNSPDCLRILSRFLEKSSKYLNFKNDNNDSLLEQVMRNSSIYGEEIGRIVQLLVSMGARVEDSPSLVKKCETCSDINDATISGQEIWKSKGVLGVEGVDCNIFKKELVQEDNTMIQDTKCQCCGFTFTLFKRKFSCVLCKEGICNECSSKRIEVVNENYYPGSTETKFNLERTCDECYNKLFSIHDTEESRRQREREMIERLSVGRLVSPQEDAYMAATAAKNALFFSTSGSVSTSQAERKDEKSIAQHLLETTGMSALLNTLGEAQDQLNLRGQKLEDLGEKTERLAMNAGEFEKLAKKLNEERSSWW